MVLLEVAQVSLEQINLLVEVKVVMQLDRYYSPKVSKYL